MRSVPLPALVLIPICLGVLLLGGCKLPDGSGTQKDEPAVPAISSKYIFGGGGGVNVTLKVPLNSVANGSGILGVRAYAIKHDTPPDLGTPDLMHLFTYDRGPDDQSPIERTGLGPVSYWPLLKPWVLAEVVLCDDYGSISHVLFRKKHGWSGKFQEMTQVWSNGIPTTDEPIPMVHCQAAFDTNTGTVTTMIWALGRRPSDVLSSLEIYGKHSELAPETYEEKDLIAKKPADQGVLTASGSKSNATHPKQKYWIMARVTWGLRVTEYETKFVKRTGRIVWMGKR